jgi:hypothetical protein
MKTFGRAVKAARKSRSSKGSSLTTHVDRIFCLRAGRRVPVPCSDPAETTPFTPREEPGLARIALEFLAGTA